MPIRCAAVLPVEACGFWAHSQANPSYAKAACRSALASHGHRFRLTLALTEGLNAPTGLDGTNSYVLTALFSATTIFRHVAPPKAPTASALPGLETKTSGRTDGFKQPGVRRSREAADGAAETDEEMARRLQAEGQRRRPGGGSRRTPTRPTPRRRRAAGRRPARGRRRRRAAAQRVPSGSRRSGLGAGPGAGPVPRGGRSARRRRTTTPTPRSRRREEAAAGDAGRRGRAAAPRGHI